MDNNKGQIVTDITEAKLNTIEFNQLDSAAQEVWAATGDAKHKALVVLIKSFKFKDKTEQYLTKADNMATDPIKMDKFAADLMQVGHGNKVVL